MTEKVLAIIPARGGSQRIPHKNIREFVGKPLIAYAIEQAKKVSFVSRVIVDTDSPEIAAVARKYGAEVPFLRPAELAGDDAQVVDAILHLLTRLKEEEKYEPTHILILQTTSPLRELCDIEECWTLLKRTGATTALTVAPTHPRLYHLDEEGRLVSGNKFTADSTNVQAWRPVYLLNGCFAYIIAVAALRREKKIITKETRAVVCDKWRSVDLDTPEDWVIAEILYKNKEQIAAALTKI